MTWSRIPYLESDTMTDGKTDRLVTEGNTAMNSVAESGPGFIAVGTYEGHPLQATVWVARP